MPWVETNAMREREKFILDHRTGNWKMVELCERHGISTKTGYKWLARFTSGGYPALKDQSRAPKTCSQQMSEAVRARLLEVKAQYPTWGARKVRNALLLKEPRRSWPAESTVNELFRREGLVKERRRRRKHEHPGRPYVEAEAPNEVWTVDFKGEFKTQDGVYCYPLTVADLHSRYVLACRALLSTKMEPAMAAFKKLFLEVGLPKVILSDNGVPFCSPQALHGLSRLNVWWMSLGIVHVRTQPASPQQNGVHERMHRTLKAETTRPPGKNREGQQQKFHAFRRIYNQERPHEGIANLRPADLWTPSERQYPSIVPAPDYPQHYEVRRVSPNGSFRFRRDQLHLAAGLRGHDVGLEEAEDGIWNIFFYNTLVGRLNEREKRVCI
jgi:putative transposase